MYAGLLFILLQNGEFPTDRDSIGIPIAGFLLLWIVGIPFLVVACGAIEMIGRKYDPELIDRGK